MIKITKVYPIAGRKDFFKYVVLNNGEIHRGFQGNESNVELHFDNKKDAENIARALKSVQERNRKFLSDDGFEPTKNY